MKPIVAIIGRPNVGKSTFFNRVTKSRDALVENFPGVTRDRIYGDARWNDVEFTLIDTGGFTEATDNFAPQIRLQVQQAMEDADVVIFMLDGKGGISPFDQDIVQMLRATTKPVMVVVNKIDGIEKEKGIYDFYSLGIEDPYPVSAEHGYGIPDFLDDLEAPHRLFFHSRVPITALLFLLLLLPLLYHKHHENTYIFILQILPPRCTSKIRPAPAPNGFLYMK